MSLNPDLSNFLDTLVPEKRTDSLALIDLMQRLTGEPASLSGGGMIGFGRYHYRYESGHEGDTSLLAFAPRKDKFSIYLAPGADSFVELLAQLGKHKMGKGCLYVKKLADVNLSVLEALCQQSIDVIRERFPQ